MALESIHQEFLESTIKHDSTKSEWYILDYLFKKTKHFIFQ